MCGIVGYVSKNSEGRQDRAIEYIVNQYQDQYQRGTKGFGIIEVDNDGFVSVLRATTEPKMLLDLYGSRARTILLHHRQPTSTDNTMDQTHPIEVEHEELTCRWYVTHNGHVSNAAELKKIHEERGYVYLTEYKETYGTTNNMKFLDSEALAIELAMYFEGITKEISAKGGHSFVAVAVDKEDRIKKIIVGGNGYGQITLDERAHAFAFASEESAGTKIPNDTAVEFLPIFTDKKAADVDHLVGFKKALEDYVLPYAKVIPAAVVVQRAHPYHGTMEDDERDPIEYGRPGVMGYRDRNKKGPPVTPPKQKINTPTRFDSFGSVINHMIKSDLGKVFNDSYYAQNEAVINFDLVSFNREIVSGNIEAAEQIYHDYCSEAPEWLDVSDVLSDQMMPHELDLKSKDPTNDQIVEAYTEMSRKRIGMMAKEYMPLMKVLSYCEAVIMLAHQYRIELTQVKELTRKSTLLLGTTSEKIDMADPDKAIDEQMDKDIAQVFPGNGKGADDERETGTTIIEADYREVAESNAEEMDSQAGAKVEALVQSAGEMTPEEVYQEADEVSTDVRLAAEVIVLEQLRLVCTYAAEEGVTLKIPFPFTRISDKMNETKRRFVAIAQLVKTTREREESDRQGTLHLSG